MPKRIVIDFKAVNHYAWVYVNGKYAGEHEDEQSLKTYASDLLGPDLPDDQQAINRSICEKLLVSTNENLLGVFFWFVLLGPMGALMFRIAGVLYYDSEQKISEETAEHMEFNNSTRLLYAILLWLPAQLTTLAFAITGSFIDTLHEWKSRIHNDYLNPKESEETLFHTGLKSLQMDPETLQYDLNTIHDILALCWYNTLIIRY